MDEMGTTTGDSDPWTRAFRWLTWHPRTHGHSLEGIAEQILIHHQDAKLETLLPTLPERVDLQALQLPTRPFNVLMRVHLRTGTSIGHVSTKDLLSLNGSGTTTVRQILIALLQQALIAATDEATQAESRSRQTLSSDFRDPTIGDLLPPLSLLAEVRLDSSDLDRIAIHDDDRNALAWVRRLSECTTVGELIQLRAGQVLHWRGVGHRKQELIMAYLGRVSTDAFLIADGGEATIDNPELAQVFDNAVAERDAALATGALSVVASWVMTIKGSCTWRDLIEVAGSPRPRDVESAWQTFVSDRLPVGQVSSAQVVLSRYLAEIDDRGRALLLSRVTTRTKRRLEDLGTEFGVTRERVRQLEMKVQARVEDLYTSDPEWQPVRWASQTLVSQLGSMVPTETLDSELDTYGREEKQLLLWLAGFRRVDAFEVLAGTPIPTIEDTPRLIEDGKVIDEFLLLSHLSSAGVSPAFTDKIVNAIPGLNRIDGQLVDWTGSQIDRAVAVLELRDEPQDLGDLFELVGGTSMTSFRNRAFEDPRLIRVTKTKVGLGAWGGTRYTSIVDLMRSRLSSGPMDIADLSRELSDIYEVSANSVAMYAQAPVFKVTGDTVALRQAGDIFVPRNKPALVTGLYWSKGGTLIWHVRVDADTLRGSGRVVPAEVAIFLGLQPGDSPIEISTSQGPLTLSWPETSHVGPQIGSLRHHAQSLGADDGVVLRLEMHADGRTNVTVPAKPSPRQQPAGQVSSLTGVTISGLDDLAAAIRVAVPDVVTTLQKRNDLEVARIAQLLGR